MYMYISASCSQFKGLFETNIDVRGDSAGELSTLIEEVFHRAAEHVWTSISLVEDIDMKLVPKFNVTLDSYLDLRMSGAGNFRFGFDQSGELEICKCFCIASYGFACL